MNRCPSCGMPLLDGQEYCAQTSTMVDGNVGSEKAVYKFVGCQALRFESLDLMTRARHAPGDYRKTVADDERARALWGKDCIITEYGPLPNKPGTHSEGIRGQFVDHSAWAE